MSTPSVSYKQHALKGQKLLAQGVLRNSIRTGRSFSDEAKKAFKFLNIEI
jgi:hypothetical protein